MMVSSVLNAMRALLLLGALLAAADGRSVRRDELAAEAAYLSFARGMIDFISTTCDVINSFTNIEQSRRVNPSKLFVLLYTPDEFAPFAMTNASAEVLNHPTFDVKAARTVIYIHGFNGLYESEDLYKLGRTLTRRGDNLLSLNARAVLHSFDYIYTSGFVPHLGKWVSNFLSELYLGGVPVDAVHLVGHSIGAHVAGYAARSFRRRHGHILPRITGLDPAAPCFTRSSLISLSQRDAQYVDVIRTSALSHRDDPIGHADYVVNSRNGTQPGCELDVYCSHDRANVIFVESSSRIGKKFIAMRCTNMTTYECDGGTTSEAGFSSDKKSRGFYLLRTRDYPPYAMGKAGVR